MARGGRYRGRLERALFGGGVLSDRKDVHGDRDHIRRGGCGYFTLDGLELSQAECVALDLLGFSIFVAAHRLANSGEMPQTIHGLLPEQLEILRAEAVNIGANALMAAARDTLPIEICETGGAMIFRLRSHLRPPGSAGS